MKTATQSKKPATIESLTAEVTQLKGDLERCLDQDRPYCSSEMVFNHLRRIVEGALQPIERMVEHKDGDVSHFFECQEVAWRCFVYYCLESNDLAGHWAKEEFRRGVHNLLYLYSFLDSSFVGSTECEPNDLIDAADILIEEGNEAGTAKLKELESLLAACNTFKPGMKNRNGDEFMYHYIETVRLGLTTAITCQRIWLSSQKEDESHNRN